MNQPGYIWPIYYVFFVSIFFVCCNKDDSKLPPSVSFSLPLENSIFNIPDTLQIKATISSESPLEFIELRIVNQNYIPVTDVESVSASGLSHNLDEWLLIDDIYLESGVYFVEIAATASGETKRKYRQIVLNEYPLMAKRICIFTNDGHFNLIDMFSDTLEINLNSTPGGISLGIVDNYNRQVVVGNSNGMIQAFDVDNFELVWTETNNNSVSNEYFNDVQYNSDLKRVYFSDNNGDIRGYNAQGDLVDLIDVGDDLIPESFYIDEKHVLVEVSNLNQSSRFLQVFFRSTGSLISNIDIDQDITRILDIDDNQFIIAGNGGLENEIAIFFLDENAFFFPSVFGSTGIKDIAKIDDHHFAIAHASGVYHFDQLTNSLTLLYNQSNVQHIDYDPVNDILMMIADNQLITVNMTISSMMDQYSFSSSVKGIDILYNK